MFLQRFCSFRVFSYFYVVALIACYVAAFIAYHPAAEQHGDFLTIFTLEVDLKIIHMPLVLNNLPKILAILGIKVKIIFNVDLQEFISVAITQ